jgi:hypothetical protein
MTQREITSIVIGILLLSNSFAFGAEVENKVPAPKYTVLIPDDITNLYVTSELIRKNYLILDVRVAKSLVNYRIKEGEVYIIRCDYLGHEASGIVGTNAKVSCEITDFVSRKVLHRSLQTHMAFGDETDDVKGAIRKALKPLLDSTLVGGITSNIDFPMNKNLNFTQAAGLVQLDISCPDSTLYQARIAKAESIITLELSSKSQFISLPCSKEINGMSCKNETIQLGFEENSNNKIIFSQFGRPEMTCEITQNK